VSRVRLRDFVITSVPQYPGYKTSIVAPEPFAKRVPGANRSSGGRIGTHMLLWVPLQDRVATMGHRGTIGLVTCDRSRDL
jgi:hypothetical protein